MKKAKLPAIVNRRSLKWLLDYAQEERDVDYASNYSPSDGMVTPHEVRKRLEKFDRIAAELRTALS
jgi:hypothetical protein